MDKELLVVRCTINLKPLDFENIISYIEFQRTTGTVLLPSYCEAIVVPKDIEVKFENGAKKSKDYNPVRKAYDTLLKFINKDTIHVGEVSAYGAIEEAIGYLGEALE